MLLKLGKLRKKAMMKITLYWGSNLQKPILTIGINLHTKKEKRGNLSIKGSLALIWETRLLILLPATIKPMMEHRHQKHKKSITIQEKLISF